MANNTRDIIDNQNAGTRAILDYLCQEKISDLQNENQALRLAASQSNQNAVLMAAMDAVIDELPGDQRRVVELRYKQGCRWEFIAVRMCFSVQHVKRLEAAAIAVVGENISIQKQETK